MDSLHQRHEDWLINKTVKLVFVNLLRLGMLERGREGGREACIVKVSYYYDIFLQDTSTLRKCANTHPGLEP